MVIYRFWADLVVVVHAAYVGIVLGGFVAILLGILFHWNWIRNFWFRAIHFLMIGIVVVESLLDIVCPLTTWENDLRLKAGDEAVYPGSFLGRWVHDLLFYDAPTWVMTLAYCIFGLLVLAALVLAPPRWPWKTPAEDAERRNGDVTACRNRTGNEP